MSLLEIKNELAALSAEEQAEIATCLSRLLRKSVADSQVSLSPPQQLYKYRKLDANTIDAIVRSVAYFAKPFTFNDPFDCRLRPTNYEGTEEEYRVYFTKNAKKYFPAKKVTEEVNRKIRAGVHHDEHQWEAAWKAAQTDQNEKVGLLCLTKNPDNILMWSHYADCHRGCCLEFSTAESVFKMARLVEYPKIYPNYRFLDCMNDRELFYKLTFFTKSNLWEYEQEWRVLFDERHEKGAGLYKFENKALTGIIFGWNMAREHKELLGQLVSKRNPPVQLYQAHPYKREFRMKIVLV